MCLAVGLASCVSGTQHNAADQLEEELGGRSEVVSATVTVRATSASLDNASAVIALDDSAGEAVVAELLTELPGIVADSDIRELRHVYVVLSGDEPLTIDDEGIPDSTRAPRILVSADLDGPLLIEPEIAASRLFRVIDEFGNGSAVTTTGEGAVTIDVDAGTSGDAIGPMLGTIAADREMAGWDDGWTLTQEGQERPVGRVATDGAIDGTVASAWQETVAAFDLAPDGVERYHLAFERPFDSWNVYSWIDLGSPVLPAALTPERWEPALRPLIDAQLAATSVLGEDRTFSMANFYGPVAEGLALDTFLATAPSGNFVDRGWNDAFLLGDG